MMRRLRLAASLVVLSLAALPLSACEVVDKVRETFFDRNHVNLTQTSYDAVDRLAPQTERRVTPGTPLRVAILTDSDHPGETTPFGQQVADQIAARFTQLGYNVQSGTVTPEAVQSGFTGAPAAVSASPAPQPSQGAVKPLEGRGGDALVRGTYTRLKDSMLINLKITQGAEQRVIAAYDYTLLLTDELRLLALSDAERRGAAPEQYHPQSLNAQPVTDAAGQDPPPAP